MDLKNLPTIESNEPGEKPVDPATETRRADGAIRRRPTGAKKKRIIAIVVSIVVLALIGAGIWWFAQSQQNDFFDDNAILGQAPYKTPEEVQAELDRIVEEGMFNISIASIIEFADGTAPGTAYIENGPGNRYVMQVTITLDDTGETVYESKGLKPDSYIDTVQLSKDLEPGNYAATATFSALDPDSLEDIGKAAAKVTLSVLG